MPYKDPAAQAASHCRWRAKNRERILAIWKRANDRRAGFDDCPYAPRDIDTDYWAIRCWWHRFTTRPCTRLATWMADPWGCSEWQACDHHRRPSDVPIPPRVSLSPPAPA